MKASSLIIFSSGPNVMLGPPKASAKKKAKSCAPTICLCYFDQQNQRAHSIGHLAASMAEKGAKARYRSYIGCINDGIMDQDLPKYCHAQVIHNDHTYSLSGYKDMIQSSKDAIPDLHFSIDTLIYDEASQKLAVRLLFTGTPTGTIAGIQPTGKSVNFSELVFYQLENGLIKRVWSLVDWDSVRQQMS
jgi:predicted ester cyclase